jgi:lysozyme
MIRKLIAVSAVGIMSIAGYEGMRTDAYLDQVNVPTIGYGHTEGVELGDTITEPEAREMLEHEVRKFKDNMAMCLQVPLYQYEADAYISLTYNIGYSAFCRSTLLRKLNAHDYQGACKEILRWNRAGGRVNKGLDNRRKKEYKTCIGE